MYWSGWTLQQIADYQGLPAATVRSWKTRDEWDKARPLERVEGATEARLIQLVGKGMKTGGDFKEIDLLSRQMERFARIHRYENGGHEGDLNPKVANRNAGPKKAPRRNVITAEQLIQLKARFDAELFGYQEDWRDSSSLRTRILLKSRQIGATWYFAREALIDAVETGRNQIFLSASKAQAHVFRQYICAFVRETIGVELTGDPIIIDRGDDEDGQPLEQPHLYFLGTNARTAQSFHGNFYFDEFFWVYGFKELKKVASGMAMHKRWRKTFISTPSSINHEAYGFWTGADWNRSRPKDKRQDFDTSWKRLRSGLILPDRAWRQIVTIEDAEARGCDLFDLDELREEYSADEFANLLMCEFIDDTLSVFSLAVLQRCQVDTWEEGVWPDFSFAADALRSRPFGDQEVWIGYDPAATGDNAALIVVAPPSTAGGKFRVLKKVQFKGYDFMAQAQAIQDICERFNVTKIDIDKTGIGLAVYQLVVTFFAAARGHQYSPEVKTRLVLKVKDVVSRGRLQYDAGWTDLTASCLAIKKTMTASGRQSTYAAGRTDETGHADLFWALAHALDNEPLDVGMTGGRRGFILEIH